MELMRGHRLINLKKNTIDYDTGTVEITENQGRSLDSRFIVNDDGANHNSSTLGRPVFKPT